MVAMTYTAWSEWHNVYETGSWGYTAEMPTISGIGISPLLQWLVLPPLMVIAYRKFGSVPHRRRGNRVPIQPVG